MRSAIYLILLLTIIASQNSQAIELYNCEIQASPQDNPNQTWTKKAFLIPNLMNQITFNKTELSLTVMNKKLWGTVNGQPNFMLEGTPENGIFASAYHKGTIYCTESETVDYLFKFKPWKQFFTIDTVLSEGHIQNSFNFSSIRYGHICFVGNAKHATVAIDKYLGLKGNIKSPYSISFTKTITDCIEGYGNIDDWTCTRHQTRNITKTIDHCFESENQRT